MTVVAGTKLSALPANATGPVYGTDYWVGVSGANVDYRYPAGVFDRGLLTYNNPGNHQGSNVYQLDLQANPVGANGTIGGIGFDFNARMQITKANYGVGTRSSTQAGNLGGLYIQTRNTGPSDVASVGQPRNDTIPLELNTYTVGNSGFNVGCEMLVGNLSSDGLTVLKEADIKLGAINAVTDTPYANGIMIDVDVGVWDSAILVQSAGGTWTNVLKYDTSFVIKGDIGAGAALYIKDDGGYNSIYFNGDVVFPNAIGIQAGNGADTALYFYSQGIHSFWSTGTEVAEIDSNGAVQVSKHAAVPAGGAASCRVSLGSTTAFGVYAGSGPPSFSATKGSLYLRTDGSGTTDRAFIARDSVGTWTALTTVA